MAAAIATKLKLLKQSSRKTVLLGASGSVASIKTLEIAGELIKLGYNVVLVPTQRSLHFISMEEFETKVESLNLNEPLFMMFQDVEEWQAWQTRSDPVLHIELRKLSDTFVVAPLSANTMGKFANGLADNLLSCVFRAWDFKSSPCIVAPAMNTYMYESPLTEIQESFLSDKLGVIVLPTVEKVLVCGDKGKGAMASVSDIVQLV